MGCCDFTLESRLSESRCNPCYTASSPLKRPRRGRIRLSGHLRVLVLNRRVGSEWAMRGVPWLTKAHHGCRQRVSNEPSGLAGWASGTQVANQPAWDPQSRPGVRMSKHLELPDNGSILLRIITASELPSRSTACKPVRYCPQVDIPLILGCLAAQILTNKCLSCGGRARAVK